MANLQQGQGFVWSTANITQGPFSIGGQLFGGDLAQAPNVFAREHQPFTPGANRLGGVGAAQTAAINNQNLQIGTGPVSLLAGHVVDPNGTPFAPAPPTHLGSHAEISDAPIPIRRIVGAPQVTDIAGDGQLLFIKKPTNGSQRMTARSTAGAGVTGGGGGRGHRVMDYDAMDGNTLVGLHPMALNEFLIRKQYELFKKDPRRYWQLTGSDIMNGVADLDWTGWTCDGIPRLEEVVGGGSSKLGDGYNISTRAGRIVQNGVRYEEKSMSVVRAGRVRMQDIFHSRGIGNRSFGYLVMTKKAWASDQKPWLEFVKTSKTDVLDAAVPSVTTTFTVDTPTIQKTYNHATDKAFFEKLGPSGFIGFMLYPVACPDGGSIDPSFYEYDDEWEARHYDAVVLPIGRILFEPFRYEPMAVLDTPQDAGFQPLINGKYAMQREAIPDILLQPCKDGLFGML